MIRFNFKPDDKMLNPYYQRLEYCINEMNKASNVDGANYWALEAHKVVCQIWEIDCRVLDINGGNV